MEGENSDFGSSVNSLIALLSKCNLSDLAPKFVEEGIQDVEDLMEANDQELTAILDSVGVRVGARVRFRRLLREYGPSSNQEPREEPSKIVFIHISPEETQTFEKLRRMKENCITLQSQFEAGNALLDERKDKLRQEIASYYKSIREKLRQEESDVTASVNEIRLENTKSVNVGDITQVLSEIESCESRCTEMMQEMNDFKVHSTRKEKILKSFDEQCGQFVDIFDGDTDFRFIVPELSLQRDKTPQIMIENEKSVLDLIIQDGVVTWSADENADRYIVQIGDIDFLEDDEKSAVSGDNMSIRESFDVERNEFDLKLLENKYTLSVRMRVLSMTGFLCCRVSEWKRVGLGFEIDSVILRDKMFEHTATLVSYLRQTGIREYDENHDFRFDLLYRASRDGDDSRIFHKKCDNHGATVSIIHEENGNVFGGFHQTSWQSTGDGQDHNCPKNFMFILESSQGKEAPVRFPVRDDHLADKYLVRHLPNRGPSFCGSGGFYIVSGCLSNKESYASPDGRRYTGPLDKRHFANEEHFRVVDYEVFSVKML